MNFPQEKCSSMEIFTFHLGKHLKYEIEKKVQLFFKMPEDKNSISPGPQGQNSM